MKPVAWVVGAAVLAAVASWLGLLVLEWAARLVVRY